MRTRSNTYLLNFAKSGSNSLSLFVFLFCSLCLFISTAESLVVTSFPHYQTFDSWPDCYYEGLCYEKQCNSLKGGWVNPEWHPPEMPYTDDVRHWWVMAGITTSNMFYNETMLPCDKIYTGPCGDHTSGHGKYMYIESSACFGFNFRVVSPTIVFSAPKAKFSFHYYMHGDSLDNTQRPGILKAEISFDNGTNWQTLTTITGQQQTAGNQPWGYYEAIVDSQFPGGQSASPQNPVTAMFQFYATAAGTRDFFGTFWKGDMAIDDVVFTQQGASNVLVPYVDPPTPVPTNSTYVDNGGDGLSDGQIVGIVVGTVGGLAALCCLLCLFLILLLLLISPRKSKVTTNEDAGL